MFKLISDIFTILSGILCVILAIIQIIICAKQILIFPILLFGLIGWFGLCLIDVGVKEIKKGKEK